MDYESIIRFHVTSPISLDLTLKHIYTYKTSHSQEQGGKKQH